MKKGVDLFNTFRITMKIIHFFNFKVNEKASETTNIV